MIRRWLVGIVAAASLLGARAEAQGRTGPISIKGTSPAWT
jgi:hypothetical protein